MSKPDEQPAGTPAAVGEIQGITDPQKALPAAPLARAVAPASPPSGATPESAVKQTTKVTAAAAVTQDARGSEQSIKGEKPPETNEPTFKEFDDIPFPTRWDEPARSNGKLDEVPEIATFITRMLKVAEAKAIIFPERARMVAEKVAASKLSDTAKMDMIREAYMPRIQYDLRKLGPVLMAAIVEQYRGMMARWGSRGVALVRQRWLQAMRELFKFLESVLGRKDDRSYIQFAYGEANWRDRSKCVDLVTSKGFASLQAHAPIRPIVLSVIDQAWDLAQADPKSRTTFFAESRYNEEQWKKATSARSQDQHNWGISLDLYLGPRPDVRTKPEADGFWKPGDVIRMLSFLIQAARMNNAHPSFYYDDSRVARAINTDHVYVKPKLNPVDNWHGPDPMLLHVHMDVTPL